MAEIRHHHANAQLALRFVDAVWNGEDLDAVSALTTDDFVVHHLGAGVDRDRQAFRDFHRRLLDAVPDLTHVVEDVVEADDRAVVYVTISGTPERQIGALSPTGKSFDAPGFQMYRFDDGKVAEVWVLPNAMEMLRQLGVFPDSPAKMLRLVFGVLKGRLLGG